MLNQRAMLVNLTIHQWSARRHDKAATKQVELAHGAKNAGRYNKLLIDEAALQPLSSLASSLRQQHYKLTLPWGDNGDRLLPSKLYLRYTQEMRELRDQFNTKADEFVAEYPRYIQEARQRLGGLYDPSDYPATSEIRRRFGVEMTFLPVPTADDFRVQVSEDHANQIRREITEVVEQRQAEAFKSIWARAREVVERIAETCSKDNPRIYDSMMDNTAELVGLLEGLNVNDDPELTQLARDIQTRLVVRTDRLRNSAVARSEAARAADEILSKMPW